MFGIWCLNILVLLIAIGAVNGYRINKRALSEPQDESYSVADLAKRYEEKMINKSSSPATKPSENVDNTSVWGDLKISDMIASYEDKTDKSKFNKQYPQLLQEKKDAEKYATGVLKSEDTASVEKAIRMVDKAILGMTKLQNELSVSDYKKKLQNEVNDLRKIKNKLQDLRRNGQKIKDNREYDAQFVQAKKLMAGAQRSLNRKQDLLVATDMIESAINFLRQCRAHIDNNRPHEEVVTVATLRKDRESLEKLENINKVLRDAIAIRSKLNGFVRSNSGRIP